MTLRNDKSGKSGIMHMTDNCGRDAALRRPRPRRAGGIVGKLHPTSDVGARTAQRAVPTCFFRQLHNPMEIRSARSLVVMSWFCAGSLSDGRLRESQSPRTGAAATVRAGLQPGQLSAAGGAAQEKAHAGCGHETKWEMSDNL